MAEAQHRRSKEILRSAARIVLAGISCAALLWCIATAKSVWDIHEHEREWEQGISRALFESVIEYQDDDGLFHFPESPEANALEMRIQATYFASGILHGRFEGVLPGEAQSLLESYMYDEANLPLVRLYAGMAIKRTLGGENSNARGGTLDKTLAALIRQEINQFGGTVTQEELGEFLNIAPLCGNLDCEGVKPELIEFDPGENEDAQRIALSAIANAHAFSNEEDVRSMFAPLQEQASQWIVESEVPLPQFLISLVAIEGSSLYSVQEEQYEIEYLYHSRKGCEGSEEMFSIDGKPDSTCSFVTTYLGAYTMFAFDVGSNE